MYFKAGHTINITDSIYELYQYVDLWTGYWWADKNIDTIQSAQKYRQYLNNLWLIESTILIVWT